MKLNPDPAWGTRTQNVQVLGRAQSASGYTNLVSAANYTFTQGTNVVSIPVTATVADVQLRFNSNTGAPSGQVAEFEVCGTPAPNPDLTVSNVTWSPTSPIETSTVTLSATVANIGDQPSPASSVNFYLGSTLKGSASVGALAAGGSTTVNLNAGTLTAASYVVTAKVDEANAVIERNDANNSATAASSLVVAPVQSSDLVPVLSYTPSNPSAGNTVTFSVAIANQGNVHSAGGGHGITLTLLNDTGGTVITRTGTFTGTINAGATSQRGQPRHVDRRQRPVHDPGGACGRRERAVRQAGQQHQQHQLLRRPRREHALRHVRGRGRQRRRRRPGARRRTGPSATSPVRRRAAGRSRSPAPAASSSG